MEKAAVMDLSIVIPVYNTPSPKIFGGMLEKHRRFKNWIFL